jgi:hypothetical protein
VIKPISNNKDDPYKGRNSKILEDALYQPGKVLDYQTVIQLSLGV